MGGNGRRVSSLVDENVLGLDCGKHCITANILKYIKLYTLKRRVLRCVNYIF